MPENNQVLFTNLEDIERMKTLVTGSQTRNLRAILTKINRRILIFERRLVELYNNESIVKARIYNNVDLIEIESKYPAGKNTKVEPQQSFQYQAITIDPHHSVSYDKNRLYALGEGVKEFDSELAKINNDIQTIQSIINGYKKSRDAINERLEKAAKEKEEKKNLVNKTLEKVLPPTPEDMKADEIARSRSANMLLLYRVSLSYESMSINPETGARGFTDEKIVPNNLATLRQVFWAHAQQFSEFLEGEDKLDFNDPGSIKNQLILSEAVGNERYTAKNTKTSLDVDSYIKDLENVANNTTISKGIERKPDPELPVSDSLRLQTVSYPAVAMRLGDAYIGSFELPTFTESLKKWWKNKNSQLYYNLPVCPNKPTDLDTSTDTKQESQEDQQAIIAAEGAKIYEDALKAAQAYQEEQQTAKIGDLPDAAPDWVRDFARMYGEGTRGIISYMERQSTVTKGTGAYKKDQKEVPLDTARKNALVIGPTGRKELSQYHYESNLGYYVTYYYKGKSTGQVKMVPYIYWSDFQETLPKDTTVKSELLKAIIYYILWSAH